MNQDLYFKSAVGEGENFPIIPYLLTVGTV